MLESSINEENLVTVENIDKNSQNFTIINEVILSEQLHDERNYNILTRILNGDASLLDYANNTLFVEELGCDLSPVGDEIKTRRNANTKIVELERISEGHEHYLKGTIEHTEADNSCQTHFIKIKPGKDGSKPFRIWECGICKKEFQHQYTLMRHLPTHTDVRKYVCKVCGKAFRQMSTLSQHKAIHTNIRPHVCNVCNKAFNRISTLISHKRTHSEVKPHKCPVCGKGFHQKGNMRNHVFTHTNERPYKCDKCAKGFNQMSNLMWHKVHIHGNMKTNYSCDVCRMMFEQQLDLDKHKTDQHMNTCIGNFDVKPSFDENFNNCIIINQNQTDDNGELGIVWNRVIGSGGYIIGDENNNELHNTTVDMDFVQESTATHVKNDLFDCDEKKFSPVLILKSEKDF